MKYITGVLILLVGTISATQYSAIGEAMIMNLFSPYEIHKDATDETLENPFVDFYNGFVDEFIKMYKADLRMTEICIACPEQIWAEWVDFYNYLINIKWENFNLGDFVGHVMQVLGRTVGYAMPCMVIGMIIDKFVELILDPTLEKLKYTLLKTLAANMNTLVQDLAVFIMSVIEGKFYRAGLEIGQFIYLVILH